MSYTGVLELSAAKREPKSIVSNIYYEGALKITRPVYLEENLPSIYLIHVGGGYVDGDTYLTNITVEEGAELAVTTQSSTKVYKTPKKPVVQKTNITLNKGSVLEYLPDPLIAYEGARFIQETVVHMEEGASLFYSDSITPGWAADGSYFRYEWIHSKLKVYKGEKLAVFDHLLLEPDDEMSGMMQMEGYTHVGMFLVLHDKADKAFLDHFYEEMESFSADVRFGVSTLPESGVILRVLARNTGSMEKMISRAHKFARHELLGKESVAWRKY
jgi:urease accessory protein